MNLWIVCTPAGQASESGISGIEFKAALLTRPAPGRQSRNCIKVNLISIYFSPTLWVKKLIHYSEYSGTFNPLTTNAIFFSDLSQTFFRDSSNFLKNKKFLHGFFFSSGHQDIQNFRFFLFLTVWTYFSSHYSKNGWDDGPLYLESESVKIFVISITV